MINSILDIEGSESVSEGEIRKIPLICHKCFKKAVFSNDTHLVFGGGVTQHFYCYLPVLCSKCKLEDVCD